MELTARRIRNFIEQEAAGGIALMLAAALALLLANSPLAGSFAALFGIDVEFRVGSFQVEKPLLLWINDGLMSIFFLLVGLELKREVLEGELSSLARIVLPGIAAIGGMAVPALVYASVNWNDAVAMRGWAIPMATDIAFALGVLLLLGKSVPTSLKLFMVSLAIVDDIGAIGVIAVFYTAELSVVSLILAGACALGLLLLNRCRVISVTPYLLLGILMWLAVLKSGVHATLAGVMLAAFIPMRDGHGESPLMRLEHDLHSTIAFGILPLFALANCGVALGGIGVDALLSPIPLGIALGLIVGKPLGVLSFTGIALALGWARLPEGSNAWMFAGVAFLTGIGFTMSLFIGGLAFDENAIMPVIDERLGILLGSGIAALAGVMLLRTGLKRQAVQLERVT